MTIPKTAVKPWNALPGKRKAYYYKRKANPKPWYGSDVLPAAIADRVSRGRQMEGMAQCLDGLPLLYAWMIYSAIIDHDTDFLTSIAGNRLLEQLNLNPCYFMKLYQGYLAMDAMAPWETRRPKVMWWNRLIKEEGYTKEVAAAQVGISLRNLQRWQAELQDLGVLIEGRGKGRKEVNVISNRQNT